MNFKLLRIIFFKVVLATIVTLLVLFISKHGFFDRVQAGGLDTLFRLRGSLVDNQKIAIIQIDDDNIARVGRWPWKRMWHATITKALKDLGAKSIYFDIMFPEASSEEDDNVFIESMSYADNVYLPFAFQQRRIEEKSALFPVKKLADKAKGTGSINIYPDIDGSLRKIPLVFQTEKQLHPHIALKIAMDYADMEIDHVEKGSVVLKTKNGEKLTIPVTDEKEMIINWLGKWKDTFYHYSFLDVLMAYNAVLNNQKPAIDIKPLKDSICLIAVTAVGLYDIKPVPLENEYPGIGTIATTISNIINKKLIRPSPDWLKITLVYLLALIPFLIVSGEKTLRGILVVMFVGILFFFIVLQLFKKGIWVEYTVPMLTLIGSYLSVATFHFIHVSIERQRFFKLAVTDGLTGLNNIRYFMMLLKTECLMAKASPEKQFAVVMTDVDHFKKFNDTYGHAIGDLVLRSLAKMMQSSVRASDVVARYGGEELIILLRGASLDNAMGIAEKVRANIEAMVMESDKGDKYQCTISLGVAYFNVQDDENTVVKRADDGLYKAKESGRNKVETLDGDGKTEEQKQQPEETGIESEERAEAKTNESEEKTQDET